MTGARVVACYASLPGEPATEELRAALRDLGVVVLLPRLLADGDLEFAADGGGSQAGRLGIREPLGPTVGLERADVVLVPALLVDRRGGRLGRGSGSYDRALARRAAGAPVVALLHPGELVELLPTDPHDVPVDAVSLPGGVVAPAAAHDPDTEHERDEPQPDPAGEQRPRSDPAT